MCIRDSMYILLRESLPHFPLPCYGDLSTYVVRTATSHCLGSSVGFIRAYHSYTTSSSRALKAALQRARKHGCATNAGRCALTASVATSMKVTRPSSRETE